MGMRETAMEATDRLVQFIADTNYNTLPEEVVSAAKIGIMDGVANMLAGATQPLAAVISTYVQQLGGAPLCSIVGHDLKSNAPSAAFANGVFLHCLDFEIQGQPPTHGTSAVLPRLWPWRNVRRARCPAHRGVHHRLGVAGAFPPRLVAL